MTAIAGMAAVKTRRPFLLFRQQRRFLSDAQFAAHAAAGEPIDPIEHRGHGGDQQQTDAKPGHLARSQAIVVEVHDHGMKNTERLL